jgi:type III secretory pathway lipoprotein EscJ
MIKVRTGLQICCVIGNCLKKGVARMARFYDSLSDSDVNRVEELLKKGGIEYSLQILGDGARLKEIQVAEEDLAAAEEILCSPPHANN